MMKNTQENATTKYDAQAKEAELQAQSAQWNESIPAHPQVAQAGVDFPVVNVSKWFASGCQDDDELKRLGRQLQEACERVGFYQLVGHGISRQVTDEILTSTRDFHALDTTTKLAIQMDRPDHPVGGVGYLGYGNHKLPKRSTSNQNASFLVKKDHRIGFEDNQWPPGRPNFRTTVEKYGGIMTGLAKKVLPIYAVALDLPKPKEYFDDAFQEPFYRLRLSHYPPMNTEATTNNTNESENPAAAVAASRSSKQQSFGISPHVDTSFMTLLLTDGTPGLTFYSHPRNEWIQMPPMTPTTKEEAEEVPLIINTGELLRQWSNDRFLSVRHFVSPPLETHRYSVICFLTAHSDYSMTCFPTCCNTTTNPPKYPPFSYNQSQGVVQGE